MPHPIRSVFAVLAGLAVLLFLPAGTWNWPNGWVFFAVFSAFGATCVQTERSHTVVSTGPYAIVRHPLHLFSFPVVIGTALALGSLWAFVPAVIACLSLILRTHWEDRTLQAELPGYKEFAQRVRFKLLPGIW
jgi:protein-S-isoprenylcysteine O-methyltransferase Ste14